MTATGHRIIALIIAISAGLMVDRPAWTQENYPLRAMTDGTIDEQKVYVGSNFSSLDGSDLIWQETINKLGTHYMRLHFSGFSNPDGESFEMTIRTSPTNVVASYTQATIPGADFWSPMIPGDDVLVQVRAAYVPQTMQFRLDKVAYQSIGGSWESIIEDPEFEEIIDYRGDRNVTRIARAVAKLTYFTDEFKSCTGFMISNNQLMTNHHCISTDEICETTMAVFGFQLNEQGDTEIGDQYACDRVVMQDYEHDFAVLEFQGNPGAKWGVLTFTTAEVTAMQDLYIVQHADGRPKQISKTNCRALDVQADGRGAGTDFSHTCDTLGGSSGSPVMTANHQVIGLHHFGINQATYWDRNRAVRVSLILEKLQQ